MSETKKPVRLGRLIASWLVEPCVAAVLAAVAMVLLRLMGLERDVAMAAVVGAIVGGVVGHVVATTVRRSDCDAAPQAQQATSAAKPGLAPERQRCQPDRHGRIACRWHPMQGRDSVRA